jgi:hypothetical protein
MEHQPDVMNKRLKGTQKKNKRKKHSSSTHEGRRVGKKKTKKRDKLNNG